MFIYFRFKQGLILSGNVELNPGPLPTDATSLQEHIKKLEMMLEVEKQKTTQAMMKRDVVEKQFQLSQMFMEKSNLIRERETAEQQTAFLLENMPTIDMNGKY